LGEIVGIQDGVRAVTFDDEFEGEIVNEVVGGELIDIEGVIVGLDISGLLGFTEGNEEGT
jgi:hypothetical protein